MDEKIINILDIESEKLEKMFNMEDINKMDLTISILGEGLPSMKEGNAEN